MKKFLLSCALALGIGANAQIFQEDFDGNGPGIGAWTVIDVDANTPYYSFMTAAWVRYQATGEANFAATSSSWYATPGTSNDWLISPSITLSGTSPYLTFDSRAGEASPYNDGYKVMLSTTAGTTVAAFNVELLSVPADTETWKVKTIDLSAYQGQAVRIAFVNNSVDKNFLLIDNIKVQNPAAVAPNCPTLTTPSNGNTAVSPNNAVLAWTAATTGGAASSYDVYFGTTQNPTTLLRNVTSTTTTVTGLQPLQVYYWRVVSKNTVGNATGCSEFSFTTTTPNPPGCVSNFSPANGATNVATPTTPLSWSAPTTGGTPTTYDVYWGTTAAGMTKLGTTPGTAVNITNTTAGVTYYWKIVPVNADGEATGCVTNTLTTANPFAPYCGPLTYSGIEPISYVNIKYNTANTSSATATGATAHESFVTKEFKVEQGTSTEISVNSNTSGNFSHFYSVFIDWNNDGDFADADENYFTTTGNFFSNKNSTGSGTTGIKTKALAVPSTATLGKKRMRVKAFYAADAPSATAIANIANPCTNPATSYGQAEDYTIEVVSAGTLAVSDVNKANVSVYPNPFTDVLNISNVDGVKSITINDMSGREVRSLAPSAKINLSNLSEGLYIVNLKMEDGSVKTFKAIKK